MSSDFLYTHFSQLIVVAHRHCPVLQSTDTRSYGRTKPAWGVLVELVLVKVYFVPDFESRCSADIVVRVFMALPSLAVAEPSTIAWILTSLSRQASRMSPGRGDLINDG